MQQSGCGGRDVRDDGRGSLLKDNLPHYTWAGIYVLEGDELVLGPYLGKPSPHTRIPLNRGICGAAASEKATIIVDDVNSDPRYLACSIETKSEIVVPIMRGDKVFGEIDIDSDRPAAFTDRGSRRCSRRSPTRWRRSSSEPEGLSCFTAADDRHRRGEVLVLHRLLLNLAHDVHPGNDAAERRAALSVVEPLAPEVQRRLIVEQDEEVRRRGVRRVPRAIDTVPRTCLRPVTLVRSSGIGRKRRARAIRVDAALDDLHHRTIRRRRRVIVRARRAMKASAVVETAIDVLQKIRGRHRRVRRVDREHDRPETRFEPHGRLRRPQRRSRIRPWPPAPADPARTLEARASRSSGRRPSKTTMPNRVTCLVIRRARIRCGRRPARAR